MNIEVCYTPQAYPLFHKENAIVVLAEALVKIKNNPMPAKITEPVQYFINDIVLK
mgnify:CR=1 FL=1